ncbi:LOW QUALITY PROTEIN: hypothetical protein Cgig2_030573 [Carnegiea gigantea]|uniref:Uncharacterized protein n=1 Tax=Carnegiea gigantea TaxID=171969 RepID=A0A9Q1GQC7_9CARY|nr:LOW QUALITY PROTEIN: hypothetical protein Cgig2_030573 [Carnegiea gigantea]
MTLPHFLDTKDRRGIAFPPLPLLKDFQTLCPDFELAVAKQATEYYELPELPQALRSFQSAFTELRWSAIESWIWLFGDRIYEARFRLKGSLRENSGAGGLAIRFLGISLVVSCPNSSSINTTSLSHIGYSSVHLSKGVVENIGRAISVPVSLHGIPSYLEYERDDRVREGGLHLALEERFAPASPPSRRFPHIMPALFVGRSQGCGSRATFYAMLLNEAVELGVAHEYTAKSMKSSLAGLRWSTFELYRPADEVEVRGSQDGQEEGSGSAGPPAPSSDEEQT